MIDRTISVCALKDILTWTTAAPLICRNIESFSYEVIVPDSEVNIFRSVTPNEIQVIPESKYVGKHDLSWFKSVIPPAYESRAGWYLQQFIKIEACRISLPDDICLIWDADSLPINPLHFINSSGQLIYYKNNEIPAIHAPYFVLIKALLDLDRKDEISFISQSFPIRGKWAEELCSIIEDKFSKIKWIDAVMDNIDHRQGISGFSEYETMGLYISNNYPDQYVFSERSYYRHGSVLIGDPALIHQKNWAKLSNCIDYICFEDGETKRIKGLNIGCGNVKAGNTPQGNLILDIDIFKCDQVDLVLDIENEWPFPDNYFEMIIANNIFEHVDDVNDLMTEINRCLQVGGLLKIEVPFIGSYNHGTDVTHKRGMTYNSFDFLFADDRNYLVRNQSQRNFDYELVYFQRENIQAGYVINQFFDGIPPKGSYGDWIDAVRRFEIPGTIGYTFKKMS